MAALGKKSNKFINSVKGRNRFSSLPKYLQTKTEFKRKYFKNLVPAFLILITLYYVFPKYIWNTNKLAVIIQADIKAAVADEYLTTHINKFGETVIQNNAFNIKNSTYESTTLPTCVRMKKIRTCTLRDLESNEFRLKAAFPMVQDGGYYCPPNCYTRNKVAVIVSIRVPQTNFRTFLCYIHSFLISQQYEYQLFILEQSQDLKEFSKGSLYNAGFDIIRKFNKFQCVMFHQMELVSYNSDAMYSCSNSFTKDNSTMDAKEMMKNRYYKDYGGVVTLPIGMFEEANGYSNYNFQQEDDIIWRLRAAGYSIRLKKPIGDKVAPGPKPRIPNIKSLKQYRADGLSNLNYSIKSLTTKHLFTYILIGIEENISDLVPDSIEVIGARSQQF